MEAVTNQMCNRTLEERFRMYLILQRYYAGDALSWSLQEWKEVASFIADSLSISYNENVSKGLGFLREIREEDLAELEFEYNRLFVGPDTLLASPYETSYRSSENTLMQVETLQVREFYYRAGLEVTKKGIEPDDHLSLELEFVCYLLANAEEERVSALCKEFLEKHLLVWYKQHCALIHKSSEHPICRGMAYVLEGFLEQEQALLNNSKEGRESDD